MFAGAAFAPGSAVRRAMRGTNIVILVRAFAVHLTLSLQSTALDGLLTAMGRMRQRFAEGAREGTTFVSAIACRHSWSWDETRQLIRDPCQSHLARQLKQRVARTSMVQRCMIHASVAAQDGGEQTSLCSRCQSFIGPPLEMAGTTVGYLLSRITRGCPFRLLHAAAARDMTQRTSATSGFGADSASSNRRWLNKLVAQSIEESCTS